MTLAATVGEFAAHRRPQRERTVDKTEFVAKGNFLWLPKSFLILIRKKKRGGHRHTHTHTLEILQWCLIIVVAKCKWIQGVPLLRNGVGRT